MFFGFANLLGASEDLPPWVTNSFPTLQKILIVILAVFAVALILCVLIQSSTSSGMGAMAGQTTETFYSKNKGKSLQGMLKRLTIIFAVAILIVSVLYLTVVVIFPVEDQYGAEVLTNLYRLSF